MNMNHAKIIAYDVIDDRKRQKIAALLEKVGVRIQKSVFLIALTGKALQKITDALEALRDPDDVIDIIPVCAKCRHKSLRLGKSPEAVLFVTGDSETR